MTKIRALLVAVVLVSCCIGRADDTIIKLDPKNLDKAINKKVVISTQPTTGPATRKAEPKKVEVKVSADARAILEQVTAAYKKVDTLQLEGTLSATIEVGGPVQQEKAQFVGVFQGPNKFRHEMKGDLVVGSTGEKIYVFGPNNNAFSAVDAPKQRVASSKIPQPMKNLLETQNPGLMCAVVDDAGQFLVEGNTEVARLPDTTIDGKPFLTLEFKGEQQQYKVMVDSKTHLVRRLVLDLKPSMVARGRDDARQCLMTFDYTQIKTGATPAAEAFAWAAPEGAREVAAARPGGGGLMRKIDAHGDDDAPSLAGKEAPDFTLPNLDGKNVSLKDHKGAVVVLDFWATWCGPCRASLPGLSKIYTELKAKGLVVYAIDQQEPKDKVAAVAKELGLTMPVLLDAEGTTSQAYGVSGIPHTVVIGKDGKIKKVVVGSGNEAKIRAAAEAAMGE